MARRGRRERVAGEGLISAAVNEGIGSIIKRHPRFREKQPYITRHIDQRKLEHALGEINRDIQERESEGRVLSDEEKSRLIYKNLANYVATGEVFDEAGQEIILRKGLEEKAARWWGFSARKILRGEDYLDKVTGAFSDIYELLKSGDYAQRMPEVYEAVTTVYDMGFFDVAVDVLAHYKLIDKKRYSMLKNSIRRKSKKGVEEARKGIVKYATAQKAAASILAIFGAGLLVLSGINITGNVIGSSFNNSTGIFSGLLFLIASFLLFRKK